MRREGIEHGAEKQHSQTLRSLHEAHSAVLAQRLSPRFYVADHHRAEQGKHYKEENPVIPEKNKQPEKDEKFRIAVEG